MAISAKFTKSTITFILKFGAAMRMASKREGLVEGGDGLKQSKTNTHFNST